ncbi:MAG: type II secretion system protein J [Sphingobacteriaceae bacterium]|jgi:prepilin-type N-terminal cleavage/methylation domain-containing protein
MSLFTHKLDGFTLAEVIITMALTSMVIMFAYGTLSYVQKLFFSYKDQNRFLQEYTIFKERMDHEILYSEWILEGEENHFKIKRDSSFIDLEFLKNAILLRNNQVCDTFHFEPKLITREYEQMSENSTVKQLVHKMRFEIEFSKQKFSLSFTKHYDASVKLKLEQGQ